MLNSVSMGLCVLEMYHEFGDEFVLLTLLGRARARVPVLLVVETDVSREVLVGYEICKMCYNVVKYCHEIYLNNVFTLIIRNFVAEII